MQKCLMSKKRICGKIEWIMQKQKRTEVNSWKLIQGLRRSTTFSMDNVPYEEWGEYIHSLLKDRGIEDGILLDLGCGTGTMTEKLADYGYDMIGVDNSEDMLELAMEKRMESGKDILYLLQDMREFELYGTVRAIVSVCDSVNYITEPEELEEVFRLVNNYLDPKGVFLFDFNTVYKYKEVMGDTVIAERQMGNVVLSG